MPAQAPSYVAGATVYPRRFVRLNGTDDWTVIQGSAATQDFVGVTQVGTRLPPVPEVTDNPHAIAGESVSIKAQDEQCEIDVGTVAITQGQLLTSDANGMAVAAVAGNKFGAVANAAGDANGTVKATVRFGELNP